MADSKLKRLLEQRNAIEAQIRREQNKHKTEERKRENRRKILVGAAVMEWAKRDSAFDAKLEAELRAFLTKDNDRALFGLPPILPRQAGAPAIPNRAA